MLPLRRFAILFLTAFLSQLAFGQDSKALVDSLVKNGVLTAEQAKAILADVAKAAPATPAVPAQTVSTTKGKYLSGLSFGGLIQQQFYHGNTNIDGPVSRAAFYTNRIFARRAQIAAKANLVGGFSSSLNFDFCGSFFDQALIQYKHSDLLQLDVGIRRVPFAYDETYSSREVKAIERSPVTNYFVGPNNNRRLAGGAWHEGVYLSGAQSGFSYTFAVTNPDRGEFSDAGGGPTANDARPSAKSNDFAYWLRVGYADKFANGSYKFGADGGYLPEQGGNTVAKASGNLSVYAFWADVTIDNLNLSGHYLTSSVKHGRPTGEDASPSGFYLQAAYKAGNFEPVLRYTWLDSDRRGVDLTDGVRSAPSGGVMDKVSEWYLGGNWYIRGNDLKLSGGYIRAESKDTLTGAPAKATSDGFRSQMQVIF